MARAVKDFFASDLLAELNIKPWWETWHGRGFSVTVAAALAINYFLRTELTLSCWPNDTEVKNGFSTAEANFVNNYCFAQITKYVLYFGALAIVHCVLVFVISSWWLHIPEVIGAFKSYVKFRTDVEELGMTAEELGTLMSQSNGENDGKLEKAREACKSLQDYYKKIDEQNFRRLSRIYYLRFPRGHITLRELYERRNIILLCVLLVTLVGGIIILFTSFQEKTHFCVITPSKESTLRGEYYCVDKIPELTNLFWLGLLAGVSAEFFFAYRGLKETKAGRYNKYEFAENNERFFHLNFFEILWANSRSNNSNFEEICCFISNYFLRSVLLKSSVRFLGSPVPHVTLSVHGEEDNIEYVIKSRILIQKDTGRILFVYWESHDFMQWTWALCQELKYERIKPTDDVWTASVGAERQIRLNCLSPANIQYSSADEDDLVVFKITSTFLRLKLPQAIEFFPSIDGIPHSVGRLKIRYSVTTQITNVVMVKWPIEIEDRKSSNPDIQITYTGSKASGGVIKASGGVIHRFSGGTRTSISG